MQLTEKRSMEGFEALVAEAYDMPPLIFDDIDKRIQALKAEIPLWKPGKAEKARWASFADLLSISKRTFR